MTRVNINLVASLVYDSGNHLATHGNTLVHPQNLYEHAINKLSIHDMCSGSYEALSHLVSFGGRPVEPK